MKQNCTLRYRLHGGAEEIGGNLVELECAGRRLILDMGLPLSLPEEGPFSQRSISRRTTGEIIRAGLLPDIPGLYSDRDESPLGIILSHPHMDHFGFAGRAAAGIPLYLGDKTRKIIAATGLFIKDYPDLSRKDCRPIQDRKTFHLGPFEITPYATDHSAFDSYAFLIRAGGRSLFYSGDLRAHGRRPELFESLLRDLPRRIDHFLLEGTMLGRGREKARRETDLAADFTRELTGAAGLVLINTSAHNVDRLETIYHCAMASGRTLVMDNYSAYLYRAMGHPLLPDSPGIRVFFPLSQAKAIKREQSFASKLEPFKARRIFGAEIAAAPSRFAMLFRESMAEDFSDAGRRFIPTSVLIGGRHCYSMWPGYWPRMPRTHAFLKANRLKNADIHCSGHAYRRDLARLLRTACPRVAVPMHAEGRLRAGFKRLYGNVLLAKKGEWQVVGE